MPAGRPSHSGRARGLAASLLAVMVAGCAGNPSSPSTAASAAAGTSTPTSTPGAPASSPTAEPSPTIPPIVGDPFAILGTAPIPYDRHISCTGSIGASDPVAEVILDEASGGDDLLMDFADPGQPRIVCTLDRAGAVQLIDARHLVVAGSADDPSVFAIVDLPEVRYHWFRLPTSAGSPGDSGTELLAVAPGLDEITWVDVEYGVRDRVHLASAGDDRVIATLPDSNFGRCGSPTDSNRAGYTRSGSALFVLDEPLPEISLIVVRGGRVALSLVGTAKARPETRPLKALWSPTSEALYYTQGGDVWRWTPAQGRQVYLPNVSWSSATISPDGTHLAYDVTLPELQSPGPAGGPPTPLHDLYLVDSAHAGRPVRLGGGHAGMPVFLSDERLWYARETAAGACGESSLAPTIYDLASATETPTAIDRVGRVWPATATNN